MADIPWPPPAIVWKGDLAFILPRVMNLSQTKVGRPPVSELDVQHCEGSKSPL
jgi:hypothetical protein